jgi:hypothetical protein
MLFMKVLQVAYSFGCRIRSKELLASAKSFAHLPLAKGSGNLGKNFNYRALKVRSQT